MKTFEEYFNLAKSAYKLRSFICDGSVMPNMNEIIEPTDALWWRELPKGTSNSSVKFKSNEDMLAFIKNLERFQHYCEDRMYSTDPKRYNELFIINETMISYRCYEEK